MIQVPQFDKPEVAKYLAFLCFATTLIIQVTNHKLSGFIVELYILLWIPFAFFSSQRKLTENEKSWLKISGLMAIASIPSFLISDDGHKASGELEKLAKFLVFPATLMFILVRTNFRKRDLLNLILLAAIVIGATALYEQIMNGDTRGYKTHGKPIIFGGMATTLAILCLVFAPYKNWRTILFSLAFGLSFYASLFSQTRGAWLAFIVILVLMIPLVVRQIRKKKYLSMILACSIVSAGAILIYPKLEPRINQAIKDIVKYQENPENSRTSLGIRLETWRAGTLMFKNNPAFGIGLGDLKYEIQAYDRFNTVVDSLGQNFQFHSEYVQIAVTRGLTGLIAFFFFVYWSLRFFYISYKSEKLKSLALAGTVTLVSILTFCLSISFLSNDNGIGFTLLLLTSIIYCIESRSLELKHS